MLKNYLADFAPRSEIRPPQLVASGAVAVGNGIGNSNCCSKPNRFAILASYSHRVVESFGTGLF